MADIGRVPGWDSADGRKQPSPNKPAPVLRRAKTLQHAAQINAADWPVPVVPSSEHSTTGPSQSADSCSTTSITTSSTALGRIKRLSMFNIPSPPNEGQLLHSDAQVNPHNETSREAAQTREAAQAPTSMIPSGSGEQQNTNEAPPRRRSSLVNGHINQTHEVQRHIAVADGAPARFHPASRDTVDVAHVQPRLRSQIRKAPTSLLQKPSTASLLTKSASTGTLSGLLAIGASAMTQPARPLATFGASDDLLPDGAPLTMDSADVPTVTDTLSASGCHVSLLSTKNDGCPPPLPLHEQGSTWLSAEEEKTRLYHEAHALAVANHPDMFLTECHDALAAAGAAESASNPSTIGTFGSRTKTVAALADSEQGNDQQLSGGAADVQPLSSVSLGARLASAQGHAAHYFAAPTIPSYEGAMLAPASSALSSAAGNSRTTLETNHVQPLPSNDASAESRRMQPDRPACSLETGPTGVELVQCERAVQDNPADPSGSTPSPGVLACADGQVLFSMSTSPTSSSRATSLAKSALSRSRDRTAWAHKVLMHPDSLSGDALASQAPPDTSHLSWAVPQVTTPSQIPNAVSKEAHHGVMPTLPPRAAAATTTTTTITRRTSRSSASSGSHHSPGPDSSTSRPCASSCASISTSTGTTCPNLSPCDPATALGGWFPARFTYDPTATGAFGRKGAIVIDTSAAQGYLGAAAATTRSNSHPYAHSTGQPRACSPPRTAARPGRAPCASER